MTLRELARICGYGSNHMRIKPLFDCKKNAKTIDNLVHNDVFRAVQKERSDKLAGDPIWCKCWHQFTSVKKGQQFRCQVVKTERVKVGEGANAEWVHKTQWARHQKRFMSLKMKQFRAKVLQWEQYESWRISYLSRNPKLPATWQVGEKRLYAEMCFCVDEEEGVRKCGCEIHLKMSELTAGLKRWRRKTLALIKANNSHVCAVRTATLNPQPINPHPHVTCRFVQATSTSPSVTTSAHSAHIFVHVASNSMVNESYLVSKVIATCVKMPTRICGCAMRSKRSSTAMSNLNGSNRSRSATETRPCGPTM